jgi:hypothetical protein
VIQDDILNASGLAFESVVLFTTLYCTWSLVHKKIRLKMRRKDSFVDIIVKNGALHQLPFDRVSQSVLREGLMYYGYAMQCPHG